FSAALALLARRGFWWCFLGGATAALGLAASQLLLAPFLVVALASGLVLHHRPTRVLAVLALVTLAIVSVLVEWGAALGPPGPGRLIGGAPDERWPGAVAGALGLIAPTDWIPVTNLGVPFLIVLGMLVVIALEEVTSRSSASLAWAGVLAVAVAGATAHLSARSLGGTPPSVATILVAVPLVALGLAFCQYQLVVSRHRVLRFASVLAFAVPVGWAFTSLSAGSRLEHPLDVLAGLAGDPDARYGAVVLRRGLGQHSAAEAAALIEREVLDEAAMRAMPDESWCRVALEVARLYREAGLHEQSLAITQIARTRAPSRLADRARAEGIRCQALARNAGLDSEIRAVEADRLAGAESLVAAAEALFFARPPDQPLGESAARIETLLHRALTLQPESPGALLAMGQLRVREGRLVDALRCLEQAREEAPESADPYIQLARLYFGQGEDEEGGRYLAEALRIADRPPAATFALGRLLFDATSDKLRGLDLMAAALEQMPNLPWGSDILASCEAALAEARLAQQRTDEAERLARAAVTRDEANASAHHTLGRLAIQRKDGEAAAGELERAHELEPSRAGLEQELGEILKGLGYKRLLAGEREDALRLFGRLLEMAPEGVELEAIRAIVQAPVAPAGTEPSSRTAESGVQEARRLFEEGVRAAREGDDMRAEESLRASLAILPANPYALFHLGRVTARAGRREVALDHLRRAATLAGEIEVELPELEVLLGELLARGEEAEREEAVRHLEGVIARWPESSEAARAQEVLDKLRAPEVKDRARGPY
ncbi:MAG: tetratricopeptide repeat protein, partial [Planctomycetota bacterium]